MKLSGPVVILLAALGSPAPATAQLEVDILVYGATSGGAIAAYTAKQYGKSVLLVEPGRHVGGMTSGGLGKTDHGRKPHAITGLSRDFYRRIGAYYGEPDVMFAFEPKAAEQVLEQYLDRAGVEVLYSRRVKSVRKEGAALKEVVLEYAGDGPGGSDLVVRADAFIDASYEGDLMARAGVSYTIGRESNDVYGELYNGVQLSKVMGQYGSAALIPEFPEGVDPYVVPGDPASGLLPEIQAVGLPPIGSGDRGVQAYTFRMALCQGETRIPFSKPERYDAGRFELLLRMMEAEPWDDIRDGFKIDPMPKGKTDWNNMGGYGLSTDYIGKNWDYPDAEYEQRAEIWEDHEVYQKSLLWFVATDLRVADHIRTELQSWGYCPDEFLDTDGWPHQLYVREARRMIGEYVMTEHDARGLTGVRDGIGYAAYGMDSHNIQRLVVDGRPENEGNTSVRGFDPYPVAYGAITPKRSEADNLLVIFAVSASHSVFGSIRMEPVLMVLGQSAALAASMALDAGIAVQDVDIAALQRELYKNPLANGALPARDSDAYRLEF